MAKRKRLPYTIIQDGDIYGSAPYRDHTGKRKFSRQKFDKKTPAKNEKDAHEWAVQELAKIKANNGTVKLDSKSTISDLANWYKKHYLKPPVIDRNKTKVGGQKDWKRQRSKLDRITEYFGGLPIAVDDPAQLAEENENRSTQYSGGRLLSEITELLLAEYIEYRIETDDVVTATTNRDLALIRAMFIAFKKECARKGIHINLPKFEINEAGEHERERPITKREEMLLIAACVDEEIITVTRKGRTYQTKIHCKRSHLLPLILTALDTALRAGEIFKLDWKDVDLKKKVFTIHYFNSKVPKTRLVPISDRVKAALEAMPHRIGQVFTSGAYRTAWETAKRRAGITDGLRFHDLRHVGTTRLVESGTPDGVAMKITGHVNNKTFRRYIDQTAASIQDAGERLEAYNLRQQQIHVDQESTAIN